MRYSNWHLTAMFCMNAVLRSEDGRSASEACCCMILMLGPSCHWLHATAKDFPGPASQSPDLQWVAGHQTVRWAQGKIMSQINNRIDNKENCGRGLNNNQCYKMSLMAWCDGQCNQCCDNIINLKKLVHDFHVHSVVLYSQNQNLLSRGFVESYQVSPWTSFSFLLVRRPLRGRVCDRKCVLVRM